VTGVDPASPADNPNPRVQGTASPADLNVRIFDNPACAGTPMASGSGADFAGAGIPVPVADGSLTTFYAAVADTANQSACSSSSASYQEIASGSSTPVGSISPIKPKASGRGARITIDTGATAICPQGASAACTIAASATAKVRSTGKKARAKAKTITLGRRNVALAQGKSERVKLKLSPKQSALWRKAGKLRIKLTIELTVPGGDTVTESRTVALKPPARK
jgi:hypothetical protein